MRPLLLLAAASLAACAPAAAVPRPTITIAAVTPAAAEAPAPEGPDALVWSVAEDGKVSTRWIASTGSGSRKVGETSDLLLAVGADVWRWSAHEEQVKTTGCEEFNGSPPGEGSLTRVSLEKLGGPDRQEIVAPSGEAGVNSIVHTVSPVGSIGPYLFVREHTYEYACGAHGSTGVSQTVWDVSHHAQADLLEPDERGTVDTTGRASAQHLLGPEEGEEHVALDDISYVASIPRYAAHGWLSVEHAYITFACYACGDGEWSSYTRSVHVPAPRVPARARAFVRPPAAVTAYLDEHPEEKISGWSAVSKEAAAVLGATIGGHQ